VVGPQGRDIHEPITRIDYQMTRQSVGLWPVHGLQERPPPAWDGPGDNILKSGSDHEGTADILKSLVLGHTDVMSSSLVNAFRFTTSTTDSHRYHNRGFPARPTWV
jgi:hypothetical protein